jgi:1-phosphofructokinase family hexose kinase
VGRPVTRSSSAGSSPAGPASRPARIVFVAANPSIDRLIEVDALTPGSIHRPGTALAVAGGKGLNAARAAAALGARASVVAIVAGRAGEWIAERLDEAGIHASLVRDTGPTETRTCLSVLARSTGLLTEFYEPGAAIAPATWAAFEDAIARELATGDVAAIVCSGSLPPGAPAEGYARIVRLAATTTTIVDTHGVPLGLALAEHPSIVKVNASEAADATGLAVTDPAEAVRAARTLMELGAGDVVVTLGADGAIACDGASAWRLRSAAARGTYPVGSGDAFVAGLAIAVVAGSSLPAAAGAGMAAGMANALLPGAGILDPSAAAALLDGVDVSATAAADPSEG